MSGSSSRLKTWKRVGRFRRLPRERRRLFLRAALWLLVVDLGLRIFGFARVRRWLARPEGQGGTGCDAVVDAHAWAVAAAAHHHVYPMRCLPRSLVLHRFLAEAGVACDLCIGVRTEAGELRAHAWVEHEGRPVGESEDPHGRYSSLALPAP